MSGKIDSPSESGSGDQHINISFHEKVFHQVPVRSQHSSRGKYQLLVEGERVKLKGEDDG